MCKKLFEKIDTIQIIKDHIDTLYDYKTKNKRPADIILFFGIPIIISFILPLFKIFISTNLANILITSLSVFAALLFNLLLLLFDALEKQKEKCKYRYEDGTVESRELTKHENLIRTFMQEIFSNISFGIFISVLAIVFLLLTQMISVPYFSIFFQVCSYYLAIQFILTLFLVLKRIHLLLKEEFSEK